MPRAAPPPAESEDRQAAIGRPIGIGSISFAEAAPALLENGYQPLPIQPGTKRPAPERWTSVRIDAGLVENWSERHRDCGIGLRTGTLVGVDIDLLDPDLAHRVDRLVRLRFGDTPLMRVGCWPKRVLLYRADTPFPKLALGKVEVLALGQQVVAFGIHPETRQPYSWPLGDTPFDTPLPALPCIDVERCRDLLAEAGSMLPGEGGQSPARKRPGSGPPTASGPVRDDAGLVVDGRDGWLSRIAFHAVHDALAEGGVPDADAISRTAWQRFAGSADLRRPRQDGHRAYRPDDAARKVADKLRLYADGRLPPRDPAPAEAGYEAPGLGAAAAREELDLLLGRVCAEFEACHAGSREAPPRVGIRATVGLGKSALARRHLLELRQRLVAMGAPSRIVVFAPSHALAEEAAGIWRDADLGIAVLRGYEARDPATRQPMCRDIEAVRIATRAGVDVHSAACASRERRCPFFDGCLKQRNRAEVAAADVVIAAYDALYSGFAIDPDSVGLILIDEGCWARAVEHIRGPAVETFASNAWVGSKARRRLSVEAAAAATADLLDLRQLAQKALLANGPGPVRREAIVGRGLSERDCQDAIELEKRRLRDTGLYPGMPRPLRERAIDQATENERTLACIALWRTLAGLLATGKEQDGRLRVLPPDGETRHHGTEVLGVKAIHANLRGKPVLHLDATLRRALARTVLPQLKVHEIDAAAPHMHLRLVSGSFGKTTLCQDSRVAPEENRRRANRLRECVDYIRWHARRLAPGKVLVTTHKQCEPAFSGIPGVVTAHFNAIAGLDAYRDVRLLVVVGRPLPSEPELRILAGAFFGHVPAPSAGYRHAVRGVLMRDGSSRSVRAIEHEDEQAEILRAAICDDEVVQAVGRGRGVNRTAADPLEVHLLADVALPLVHDRVLAWETVVPDIVQRMLLAGIAIDSPADAALLHPGLFAGDKQAQKAFERAGFKRQNPLSNTYREMSLKSAAYRRAGRGHSWQRAWWIADGQDDPGLLLSRALGDIAAWTPD